MIKQCYKVAGRNMSVASLKGVDLSSLTKFLESFAPISLAEKWDNTGLLLEPISASKSINCILLTNDLTENVVDEAVGANAELIISYHPPIFKPLSRITNASWKERIIGKCLENKIAVYSPHTSWDSVPGGVNDWLAAAFGPANVRPIISSSCSTMPNAGAGRHCKLKKEIKISDAVQIIKKLTSLEFLNLALAKGASLDSKINNIAICAGSGSSVLTGVKADLFLTGEMPHHNLLDAIHSGTSVILCNHSNSERGFLKKFASVLEEQYRANSVKIIISEKDMDPLQIV